jgi:hypothetical protein
MGHPAIENETAFALLSLFPSDEDGRPLFVPVLQATYAISPNGRLVLASPSPAPRPEGVLHGENAAVSSYRVEQIFAFTKLATDVVLVGHACSARPVTWLDVSLRVGALGKVVRVLGDRAWVKAAGGIAATEPLPFDRMPLVYERAFGGWDRTSPDPRHHRADRRNPVGVGFCLPGRPFEDGLRLPNLEDPADPLRGFGQVVAPAGFGFVSPDWEPRSSLGGTYDEAWRKERMPLLPKDFDRRFFNAASTGLVANGHLRGDEEVTVDNASPRGRLSFRLPGPKAITCRASTRRADARFPLALDTVIVDTDASTLTLLYRGHLALRDGPLDVRHAAITDGSPKIQVEAPALAG